MIERRFTPAYNETVLQVGATGCCCAAAWGGCRPPRRWRRCRGRHGSGRGTQLLTHRHARCPPSCLQVEGRNPNGCRMPITWFASKQGREEGDCAVVQQAYGLGHEIATHGLSHSDK